MYMEELKTFALLPFTINKKKGLGKVWRSNFEISLIVIINLGTH